MFIFVLSLSILTLFNASVGTVTKGNIKALCRAHIDTVVYRHETNVHCAQSQGYPPCRETGKIDGCSGGCIYGKNNSIRVYSSPDLSSGSWELEEMVLSLYLSFSLSLTPFLCLYNVHLYEQGSTHLSVCSYRLSNKDQSRN